MSYNKNDHVITSEDVKRYGLLDEWRGKHFGDILGAKIEPAVRQKAYKSTEKVYGLLHVEHFLKPQLNEDPSPKY